MSWLDALYGGRGADPNEPEKKGIRRFLQMLGRDFGQLIATNFLVCALILPAALGIALGILLLNFPLTLLAGILGGMLAGIGLLLMADCALRSLCNDPSPWLARMGRTLSSKWKKALPLGAILITLLGGLCFVWAFLLDMMEAGQYPGSPVLVFLGFDMVVLAVVGSLTMAALAAAPAGEDSLGSLLRTAGHSFLFAPGRSLGGSAVIFAGVAVLIFFFPLSTFWAMLFGFWLPVLVAMQIFFPVLREIYGLEVEAFGPVADAEEEQTLTEKQKKSRARANWWYYNWGVVVAALVMVAGVIYVVHGLNQTVEPDYNVAVVASDPLPDDAALQLQQVLQDYGIDRNMDGSVVVHLNVYTWSDDSAGISADLSNGDSCIWILADPEGFEEASGALSEKLGADWAGQLYSWTDVPALADADLGSYDAADGSAGQPVQTLFADCKIALLGPSDGLWALLTTP